MNLWAIEANEINDLEKPPEVVAADTAAAEAASAKGREEAARLREAEQRHQAELRSLSRELRSAEPDAEAARKAAALAEEKAAAEKRVAAGGYDEKGMEIALNMLDRAWMRLGMGYEAWYGRATTAEHERIMQLHLRDVRALRSRVASLASKLPPL